MDLRFWQRRTPQSFSFQLKILQQGAEPTFEYLPECATSKLFDDFEAALENFLALYQHF